MMKQTFAAALVFPACLASASTTANFTVDTSSVTGVTVNILTIDTDVDWVSAVVFAELSSGTLFNPNGLVPGFETFENAPGSGDTYVYANNTVPGIAGGAGDLGHVNSQTFGAAEFGPTTLGVAWFGPASNIDIGIGLPLGQFSFTDDAVGIWALRINTADKVSLNLSGTIDQGAFTVDPLATYYDEPGPSLITTQEPAAPTAYPNTLGDDYWTAPTLFQPTGYFTLRENYDYTDTILRDRDPDFVDPRIRPLGDVYFKTAIVEPTGENLPSTLPEPGAAVLLGLGGLVLIRHGRAM